MNQHFAFERFEQRPLFAADLPCETKPAVVADVSRVLNLSTIEEILNIIASDVTKDRGSSSVAKDFVNS
ncbi:MAG: hypothetical protein ACE361_20030 [Aureliella sp.]